MRQTIRRRMVVAGMGGVLAIGTSLSLAGTAWAVSGGPYSSPSQDCPWYGSDWNTPQYETYPGCHNTQVSVESGGTTDGNPDNGWNDSPNGNGGNGARNTTWVQWGNDQSANDSKSTGTPTFWSVGEPGQSASPHAGCVAFNTDGTDGGYVPEQPQTYNGAAPGQKGKNSRDTAPESQKQAYEQTKYGCGNNANGTGFDLNYDYYPLVCPLLTDAGIKSLECETYKGDDTDSGDKTPQTKDAVGLTTDTGTKQTMTNILTQGAIVYFGLDDNSDDSEHDGEGPFSSKQSDGDVVGASDGGAIDTSFTPQTATRTPSLTHPEGLVNASGGFCADGNCADVTTQQETVFYGCGANTGEPKSDDACPKGKQGTERDAANYQGKQWDPYNCNSGGEQTQKPPEPDSPQECDTSSSNTSPSGSKNPNGGDQYWRQQEASQVDAEPGVQFYEDPDPSASPATPIYPNPGVYVGTCGVILGGGSTPMPAGTPSTNSAHQVVVSTGC